MKNVQHSSGYWTDPNNCKKFLLGVAIKKGIDVHNAQDWLSLSHREILSHGVCLIITQKILISIITLFCRGRDC